MWTRNTKGETRLLDPHVGRLVQELFAIERLAAPSHADGIGRLLVNKRSYSPSATIVLTVNGLYPALGPRVYCTVFASALDLNASHALSTRIPRLIFHG